MAAERRQGSCALPAGPSVYPRPGDGLEADAKQMLQGCPGDQKVGEGLPVLVSPLI